MYEDLTGRKFGRLTVLNRTKNDKHDKAQWICQCDCGNKVVVSTGHLKSGHTKSCGCYHKYRASEANKTHGVSHNRICRILYTMIERCQNEKFKYYKNYGGRGIKVCDEWRNNPQSFVDWSMSHGYEDGLTIDRIDNDGNYEPNNCRWITQKEQLNNTRRNININYNGETHTLKEWSEIIDIGYDTLRSRIVRKKWPVEKAFNTPVKKSGDAV